MCDKSCQQCSHLGKIANSYNAFARATSSSAEQSIQTRNHHKSHPKSIPGWNHYVKSRHEVARKAFLLWRESGSPREGPIALQMRQTRLSFKYAQRKCKREAQRQNANKLALSLSDQDPGRFLSMVKQQMGSSIPLPLALVTSLVTSIYHTCGRTTFRQCLMILLVVEIARF